ncbi:MAG: hypothetical protein ACFCUE_07130 [Candidatus Bathyarchaeia archaeon]|jgi:hypothetical protein
MKSKNIFKHKNGWFPKEPLNLHASRPFKPRWKKLQWVALTAVVVVVLGFAVFSGVQTFLRWSDPRLDVTANYFEKSINATSVHVGDSVEVTVRVGWHGRVLPEFAREVRVIDDLPKGTVLVDGDNGFEYIGCGGSDQIVYTLKITESTGLTELPKPKLFLDDTEIALNGASPRLEVFCKLPCMVTLLSTGGFS